MRNTCGLYMAEPNTIALLRETPRVSSVWWLNRYIQASIFEGRESDLTYMPYNSMVLVDYGFINCRTVEDRRLLFDLYKPFFANHESNSMNLHRACMKGRLYEHFTEDLGYRLRRKKFTSSQVYVGPDAQCKVNGIRCASVLGTPFVSKLIRFERKLERVRATIQQTPPPRKRTVEHAGNPNTRALTGPQRSALSTSVTNGYLTLSKLVSSVMYVDLVPSTSSNKSCRYSIESILLAVSKSFSLLSALDHNDNTRVSLKYLSEILFPPFVYGELDQILSPSVNHNLYSYPTFLKDEDSNPTLHVEACVETRPDDDFAEDAPTQQRHQYLLLKPYHYVPIDRIAIPHIPHPRRSELRGVTVVLVALSRYIFPSLNTRRPRAPVKYLSGKIAMSDIVDFPVSGDFEVSP
ncbi:hypothetical protein NP233_g5403 [Leucocoprinus birnbaumii]|uniref:Uncharacterized protein n=1 Tax=Leucocoprinus birnbaumii TaxID=56174 RepID=A0AAD5YQZ5_9AGAR|nr:hypothetical protein NP233_g5403 [Leucocoprinus birnbaumii]